MARFSVVEESGCTVREQDRPADKMCALSNLFAGHAGRGHMMRTRLGCSLETPNEEGAKGTMEGPTSE